MKVTNSLTIFLYFITVMAWSQVPDRVAFFEEEQIQEMTFQARGYKICDYGPDYPNCPYFEKEALIQVKKEPKEIRIFRPNVTVRATTPKPCT